MRDCSIALNVVFRHRTSDRSSSKLASKLTTLAENRCDGPGWGCLLGSFCTVGPFQRSIQEFCFAKFQSKSRQAQSYFGFRGIASGTCPSLGLVLCSAFLVLVSSQKGHFTCGSIPALPLASHQFTV